MSPAAFAVFGLTLAALSLYLGIVVGMTVASKRAEQQIARLRIQVASLRAELNQRRRR